MGPTKKTKTGSKRGGLSRNSKPLSPKLAEFWDEGVHGSRLVGVISRTFNDSNGRMRYVLRTEQFGEIVLPSHARLDSLLANAGEADLNTTVYELCYMGRIGPVSKRGEKKPMHEWEVGIVE